MRHGILFILTTAALTAQQPTVSNAKMQSVPAASGLAAAIQSSVAKQSGPSWIGYAVPFVGGENRSCCWNDNGRGCGLENGERRVAIGNNAAPIQLEGSKHVAVLLRAEQGVIEKIRAFSLDCPLDAGGLPFYWLTGVRVGESVSMLSQYVSDNNRLPEPRKLREAAVHAIAMHAGAEAASFLEKMATSGGTDELRKTAVFWLANSRGKQGYEIVNRVARQDASDKVREHAIFALTLSKEPEAIPAIVRIAKEDGSPRVRGQALFWLAQRASKQASPAIAEAIEKDPDTEVKKKAVFALSQMPKEEGVPKLIQVARTNTNPAVRKQAMFWLGQSRDPRALAFFEEVLRR